MSRLSFPAPGAVFFLLPLLLAAAAAFPATAAAEDPPWPDTWGDQTPAAEPSPESAAERAGDAGDTAARGGAAGEAGRGGRISPPPKTEPEWPPATQGGYLYLPGATDGLRYLIVLLALIVGYLLPTIFYSNLLRSTDMAPGPAAGLCLGLGGLATAWVIPLLLAREVFVRGDPVAWFLQSHNWLWAGGYMTFFILLALLGAMSSGSASEGQAR